VDGCFSVDQVGEEAIGRPDILDVAGRIEVTEDAELEGLGDKYRYAVKLEVYFRDGSCLKEKVLQARGSEEYPLTEAEITAKFRLLASKVLKESQMERLMDTVRSLELVKDASILAELTRPRE
jgi:2-methylcitrate dehydratase PrpD